MDYVDKLDKLILEGHNRPCLHSVCQPTLRKRPYTVVSLPEESYWITHISDFIGRRFKKNKRY